MLVVECGSDEDEKEDDEESSALKTRNFLLNQRFKRKFLVLILLKARTQHQGVLGIIMIIILLIIMIIIIIIIMIIMMIIIMIFSMFLRL